MGEDRFSWKLVRVVWVWSVFWGDLVRVRSVVELRGWSR